jgi:LacI family transcriptional regulator
MDSKKQDHNKDILPSATTQQDIARLAGVSQSVVSRVLGGHGNVSQASRAKVLAASANVGYIPDAGATTLATGKSNVIALAVANVTNGFYPYIFDKLALAIQERGHDVMLFNAAGDRDVDAAFPFILRYRVKAAVILTATLQSQLAAHLRNRGVQTVMLNRYSVDSSSSSVACDNFAGGRLVAEMFLEAGRTQLAYIGGSSSSSTNRDRRFGFLKRLEESDIAPVFMADGSFTRSWGHDAAILLKRFTGLQGVFCADDDIAMGVADRLRFEYGARVPDDIAIVGFDDVPAASWPPYNLTTVRQPVDAMIEKTLELLLKPLSSEPQHERIEGRLIRRGTF